MLDKINVYLAFKGTNCCYDNECTYLFYFTYLFNHIEWKMQRVDTEVSTEVYIEWREQQGSSVLQLRRHMWCWDDNIWEKKRVKTGFRLYTAM